MCLAQQSRISASCEWLHFQPAQEKILIEKTLDTLGTSEFPIKEQPNIKFRTEKSERDSPRGCCSLSKYCLRSQLISDTGSTGIYSRMSNSNGDSTISNWITEKNSPRKYHTNTVCTSGNDKQEVAFSLFTKLFRPLLKLCQTHCQPQCSSIQLL